jgi:signal transduction histidine kinase
VNSLATPRSALRILLGTLALNTVIALALYAAGRSGSFLENFAQSQAIGLTIAAACWSVVPWVERAKGRLAVSLPLFGLAIGGGVALGMQLAVLATRLWFPDSPAPGHGLLSARTAILSLSIGIAGTLAFYGRELLKNERIRAESEGWRAMAAERSAAQAQLQALRAQVEPHFLFNTLANVSALIDRDPSAARALVDDLARHLRATLRHARAETTTLGEELDVTASLLSIMKRRIGDRLQWHFEVADALRGEAMAPMLVQPLVENAVKHGIEPATGGGTITLRAQREADGGLVIEVADTGRGLTASTAGSRDDGGGTGLANLADRLRAIYGPRAQVTLHENAPRGTIARLRLPALPASAIAATAAPTPPVGAVARPTNEPAAAAAARMR